MAIFDANVPLPKASMLLYYPSEYDGTAGTITKQADSGNFRSAPAVWTIKNGKPAMSG